MPKRLILSVGTSRSNNSIVGGVIHYSLRREVVFQAKKARWYSIENNGNLQ